LQPLASQVEQRAGPVERFSHSGSLVKILPTHGFDKLAHLTSQVRVNTRDLGTDDGIFLLESRVINPVEETTALQGIMNLAGAVRGQDHERVAFGFNSANFGDANLEI